MPFQNEIFGLNDTRRRRLILEDTLQALKSQVLCLKVPYRYQLAEFKCKYISTMHCCGWYCEMFWPVKQQIQKHFVTLSPNIYNLGYKGQKSLHSRNSQRGKGNGSFSNESKWNVFYAFPRHNMYSRGLQAGQKLLCVKSHSNRGFPVSIYAAN